jgi:putative nucleotidyltransferase with HDIG domain
MKNGAQKKQRIKIEIDDLKTSAFLISLGLLSALMIQKGPGLERFAGGFAVSSLLLFILYKDIIRYQPHYLRKKRMLVLLGLMVAGTLGISRLSEYTLFALSRGLEVEAAGAQVFGVPVAAGAMLVALLFDFHTAIVFSFVASLLTGLWLGDPTFSLYAFVGCLTAAFTMIRCRKRTAILRGGMFVLGANLLALATILLFKGEVSTGVAGASMAFAVLNAIFVVAIVSLLLPVLEYIFKVTTDITLLELLDLDQPLMKNLMIAAPGTYHHSIIVGNLVESCAEAVGVNPLLARVGAYYHDIGKVRMPEYFIENQASGVSKHEKLTPHMSSMILTSHVKEGVELAGQYKLPEEVKDIIQQHHGNAVITYFYEKARGQQDGSDASVEAYKYPGPRPQSRISALIMMADAVEAASRVLHDPTPARIATLVDKIINHIFLTGQLDECELTLKDIYEIKNRFTRILTGILHKRVSYPGFDFDKEASGVEGKHQQPSKEDKTRPQADRERLSKGPQVAQASKGRT